MSEEDCNTFIIENELKDGEDVQIIFIFSNR